MSYNNRYKIMDVKFNKQLKNDEIVLRRMIKVGPNHKPKQPTTRELLVSFIGEQRQFNLWVKNRLDGIDVRLDGIDNRLIKLDNRIDNLVNKNNLIE